MVDLPSTLSCKSKNQSNSIESCNRSKYLVEVDPMPLHIAFCNKPGLVLEDIPCVVPLHLVNPFQPNSFVAWWQISKLPGPVLFNSFELSLHSLPPFLFEGCILIICRLFCRQVQHFWIKGYLLSFSIDIINR